MCFDAVIFSLALLVLPPESVLVSCVGAAVLNAIIAWNFDVSQVTPATQAE